MASGKVPIVIEFTAPLDDIYIDPRDFLCTAFQRWDRAGAHGAGEQGRVLGEIFGEAVIPYFERAILTTDQSVRIGLCNLAAIDPKVVEAHFSNRLVIDGRNRVLFSSAFIVRLPVGRAQIVSVGVAAPAAGPRADLRLDAFLALGSSR